MQQQLCHWNSLIGSFVQNGRHVDALHLFRQMCQEGILPDKVTFLSILPGLNDQAALMDGARMHVSVVSIGLESDVMVGSALIHMYGRCGDLECTQSMFEKISVKNVVSWNALISLCARYKQYEEASRVFHQMLFEGVLPTRVTFIGLLNLIKYKVDVADGERMHVLILASGVGSDDVVGSALVSMYGKCARLDGAIKAFHGISQPNVVSWTALITICAQNGSGKEAFQLFEQMQENGVSPNRVTYISLLEVCASLHEGWQMHSSLVSSGFESDTVLNNALVNMYGKHGSAKEAKIIFNKMQQRDVISWNVLIMSCNDNERSITVLEFYEKMCQEGIAPNRATFINLLDIFSKQGLSLEIELIHFHIIDSGFESDLTLQNVLVSVYGKGFSYENSQKMFNMIAEKDVVTWNAIITADVHCGNCKRVLSRFQQMLLEGVMPNNVTYTSSLSTCASLEILLNEGRRMHVRMLAIGVESNIAVHNSLLTMYSRCKSLPEARQTFDNMIDHDVISWNVMISAYVQNQQGQEALQLLDQMLVEGLVPDRVCFASVLDAVTSVLALCKGERIHVCILAAEFALDTFLRISLIKLYCKCNSLKGAWEVFNELPNEDVVIWNSMMAVHFQDGEDCNLLALFEQMVQQGVMPDTATYVSCIDACANWPIYVLGKQLYARIVGGQFESDVAVGTAIIKMYGNCGHPLEARLTFNGISRRNLVSWNSMLIAYAENGQGKNTLHLFKQMHEDGVCPDEITFVNVLSACSHAGLVDEAYKMFCKLKHDYILLLIDDHFNCIIDLLGRAGRLEEADALIEHRHFQSPEISMMSLLSSCKHHTDFDRGERVAKLLLELNARFAASFT